MSATASRNKSQLCQSDYRRCIICLTIPPHGEKKSMNTPRHEHRGHVVGRCDVVGSSPSLAICPSAQGRAGWFPVRQLLGTPHSKLTAKNLCRDTMFARQLAQSRFALGLLLVFASFVVRMTAQTPGLVQTERAVCWFPVHKPLTS